MLVVPLKYGRRIHGLSFPSGIRILWIRSDKIILGEFFMENRNLVRGNNGLLGAALPKEVLVGKINRCELILITKLYMDEKGDENLRFHRYLIHKSSGDNLHMLMKKGKIHNYFSTLVSSPIKSLNITYISSLQKLRYYKEGYQMNNDGPDSYAIKFEKTNNPIKLRWKQKTNLFFLTCEKKGIMRYVPKEVGKFFVYHHYICYPCIRNREQIYSSEIKTIFDTI